MATVSDTRDARLSFFGRFTDDISRDVLRPDEFRVRLEGSPRQPPPLPSYKRDGYFAFQNLKTSGSDYELRFESRRYQPRIFLRSLPSADPVEFTFAAEDEVYVTIKAVQPGPRRITFDTIPFLPRIPRGSTVRGEGGFTSTLDEELGGVDVAMAQLTNVAGLAAGQLLRIIRSRNLLAKPGPYYSFPQGTTVLALEVSSGIPSKPPIEGAVAQLEKVNAVAPVGTVVDGVQLEHVTLPGPPSRVLVLGPSRDLSTRVDARGHAVFYFPGHWPLSSVELEVTGPGHLPKTVTVAITPQQRTFASVELALV